jgi:Family of unknown function (DUF6941)
MVPRPNAIGLTLCDYVIIEERTKKVSLIGGFTSIRVTAFPAVVPFCVYAALIDGLGEASVELTVTHLDTDTEVYRLVRTMQFLDRLVEARALFRLRECTFPAAGTYLFTLLIDHEWVAQRQIRVSSEETT